jgi:hypothetical protein
MHDPFYTTEADEMSRAFDPMNTDARSSAAGISEAEAAAALANTDGLAAESSVSPPATETASTSTTRRVQHAVCPFCGTVNDSIGVPCRQCGMENNAATRQATRGKIGPWFVWQGRNPSAPGMNWATLMSLVEKGRVTPRSVVRGPTTGQLWRFAARVKGLSREFGLCWQCGAEIARQTRLCPGCKRIQQPPINPDVLLDAVDAARSGPAIPTGSSPAGRNRGLLSLTPEPVRREVPPQWHQLVPDPSRPAPVRDDIDDDDPAAPAAAAGAIASASQSAQRSLPVIDMGEQTLPRDMELRAFQLPGVGGYRDVRRRRGMFQRIVVAAIITFFVVAGVLYLHPEVRPYYVRWFQRMSGWVKPVEKNPATDPGFVPSTPSPLDLPAAGSDSESSGDLAADPWPSALTGSAAAANDASDGAEDHRPERSSLDPPAQSSSSPPPAKVSVDVAPAGQPPEKFKQTFSNPAALPDVSLSPGSRDGRAMAANKVAAAAETAHQSTTAPASTTTATATRDDAKTAAAASSGSAKVQISPPPPDPQTAERRAWELYERAIKSEQRSDYAAAVKEYQWIEQLRLPEGVGPSDVESRLERARKLLQARENADTN